MIGMLIMLASSVIAVFTIPMTADGQSSAAMLAVVAVVVISSFALLYGRDVAALVTVSATGPVADEENLRGSFRRQSSPDAAGRPRPRAPGQSRRPA